MCKGCRRCLSGEETSFHALICCDAAARLWVATVFWDCLDAFRGDMLDYLLLAMFKREKKEMMEIFLMVMVCLEGSKSVYSW